MRQECGKEPILPCPYCPYKARRTYVLNAHIKSHMNQVWKKQGDTKEEKY